MTKLSTGQVYAYARKAGFAPAAAVIMTAVVAAESGNRTDAIGDKNLTEPGEKSVGLAQINYRPSRDQHSATRDPQANLDPLVNLQHAYAISGHGSSFTPWSTFTSGAYLKNIAGAKTASGLPAAALPDTITSGGTSGQQTGWTDIPGQLGGFLGGIFGGAVSGAENAVGAALLKALIVTTMVGGGVALFVIGAQQAVAPAVNKAKDQAASVGQAAAAAAPYAAL